MSLDSLTRRISFTCSVITSYIWHSKNWRYSYKCFLITDCERVGEVSVFIPKSVTESQVLETFTNKATEDWANHTARQRTFRNASRPQINIVGSGVDLSVSLKGFVGKWAGQVFPVASATQAAELAENVVRRDTVIATALHVQRSQIGTETFQWLGEQVIGQLDEIHSTETLIFIFAIFRKLENLVCGCV